MRYKVDAGFSDTYTALALCLEPECAPSVRFLVNTRIEALAKLATHEKASHPDSRNAQINWLRLRKKAAA